MDIMADIKNMTLLNHTPCLEQMDTTTEESMFQRQEPALASHGFLRYSVASILMIIALSTIVMATSVTTTEKTLELQPKRSTVEIEKEINLTQQDTHVYHTTSKQSYIWSDPQSMGKGYIRALKHLMQQRSILTVLRLKEWQLDIQKDTVANVQRLSPRGVENKLLVLEAVGIHNMDDDIVCSAWKHAAVATVNGNGNKCSDLLRTYRKNFGKTIKKYHYLPLLDDRNINDQGIDATGAYITDGNLYGSSKDIGTIAGKLPTLTENGGRVNRVGFKRIEIQGTFAKFGFFDEYDQESLDFDTDKQLQTHIRRETTRAANEINEAQLQIDLLNSAGVTRYGGDATQDSEITGESTGVISLPTYEGLMKLSIELDDNKCPKSTKMVTGSRMIDTKTIDNARYLYSGSEILPTYKRMKDLHGEKAFIEARHYAAAGTLAKGEKGAIDEFRIVIVPDMLHWAGAGAAETAANAGYRATGGAYDIYPLLAVGSESFTQIGFQTSGKKVKWVIQHKAPSDNLSTWDPYAETGFYSIKWYYGFMVLRPEWIAIYKTVAEI